MFRGHWALGIAFALAVAFTPRLAAQHPSEPPLKGEPIPHKGQQHSKANGQEQRPNEPDPTAHPVVVLERIESAIRDLKAEADQGERKRQEDREKRDLTAQEDMAFWAKLMTIATIITVVLTGIALWAIIRTLNHTKRAADASVRMVYEAEQTTDAAKGALKISRQTAQSELRPYVFITDISFDSYGTYQMADGGVAVRGVIQIKVKNGGQTPANKVKIGAEHRISVTDNTASSVIAPAIARDARSALLGPNDAQIVHLQFAPGPDEWSDDERGNKVLIVAGRVTYSDGFARSRTTKFAYSSPVSEVQRKGKRANFEPCRYGNEYT